MQQPSVNNTPTDISLSKTVVATNAPVGTQVGVFSTVDPDANDTFTYTFDNTGVNNNAIFSVSGNQLKANSPQGYQKGSTYTVVVKSMDSGGASVVKNFNITASDVVNNAPTNIHLSNKVVATNASVGTQVGILSTVDPDVNDTFTYTFANTGVNNNNLFSISGNQLKANSPQGYSKGATYTVIVKSTDKAGASFTKTFSVTTISVPTDKVVITPGYPLYTADSIGLSWSAVSNATYYAVLWSNANNQNSIQNVTNNWVIINANTTIDSWVSVYPCNAAGCGTPTYLGPLKKL